MNDLVLNYKISEIFVILKLINNFSEKLISVSFVNFLRQACNYFRTLFIFFHIFILLKYDSKICFHCYNSISNLYILNNLKKFCSLCCIYYNLCSKKNSEKEYIKQTENLVFLKTFSKNFDISFLLIIRELYSKFSYFKFSLTSLDLMQNNINVIFFSQWISSSNSLKKFLISINYEVFVMNGNLNLKYRNIILYEFEIINKNTILVLSFKHL